MDFATFVEAAIEAKGLSVFEFERLVGDRFRDVKQGKQKPPLASLHRWAEVLGLSPDDRLRLLILADEAHGGGTIAGWIVEHIQKANRDLATLKGLYQEQAAEVAELKKRLSP
jgi:transcriptional regulator with XRE-family HTH domain